MTLTRDEKRWAIVAIFLVVAMLLVVAMADEPPACPWQQQREVGQCGETMRWDQPTEGTTTYYRVMRRQAGWWRIFAPRVEVGRVVLIYGQDGPVWSSSTGDGRPAWHFADDDPPREPGKLYSYRVIPAHGGAEGRISRPPRIWYREPE